MKVIFKCLKLQLNILKEQAKEIKKEYKFIVLAITIALLIRTFLFEPFHIPSGSMKPNLVPGDKMFVTKYTYGFSSYSLPLKLRMFEGRFWQLSEMKRGDVVVFVPDIQNKNHKYYVKRIVGLPGDKIQMKNSDLYVNDIKNPLLPQKAQKSSYLYQETSPDGVVYNIQKKYTQDYNANNTDVFHVPDGHIFVMGDNRDRSSDSRFEDLSYVEIDRVIGKARIIFFSSNKSIIKSILTPFSSIRGKRLLMKI